MPAVIVIILAVIISIPILLVIALVRQNSFRRRLEKLENELARLQREQARSARETRQAAEKPSEPETSQPAPARSMPPPLIFPPPAPVQIPRPTPEVQIESASVSESAEAPPLPFPRPPGAPEAEPSLLDRFRPEVLDWEKFLGAKLFAWIGGLALFLGIAFFVKYSFERNLISPEMRVALGYVAGIGLVIGGVVMRRKEYATTAHTLCATGIVVLYGVSFAAHGIYHLMNSAATFLVMSTITLAGFTLAVRLDAKVIAILGLLGGFLTPPLLSTGQDRPFGLFGYILLLNAGLVAISLARRWDFLFLLGVIGTVLTEIGWMARHFIPAKADVAFSIWAVFNAFYLFSFILGEKLQRPSSQSVVAVIGQAAITMGVTLFLMNSPELAAKPWFILGLTFVADVALLLVIPFRKDLFRMHVVAGAFAFVLVASWTIRLFTENHLYWALGAVFFFAVLHSVFPFVLQRKAAIDAPAHWVNLFPLGGLALMLVLLTQLQSVTLLIWPVIFLINLLLIGLGVLTASVVYVAGALLLTTIFSAAWILRIPVQTPGVTDTIIIGFFAVLFVGAGLWLFRKFAPEPEESASLGDELPRFLPALSALLPFILLMLMALRLRPADPTAIFALGLSLAFLLLWLARRLDLPALPGVALLAAALLQYVWHEEVFTPRRADIALLWYSLFYILFMAHPFFFRKELQTQTSPWAVSALSGPVHFYMIYEALLPQIGIFPAMGLIPAILAMPSIAALAMVAKRFEVSLEHRVRLLAWFGGSALFFVTMVFPIQFERQWLTVGWALEGAALLWLFHRVPHRGLPMVGIALLVVAFIRLGLNPAAFRYYERSEMRVFNWYLYAYGIVVLCLFAGARLLAPPRHLVLGKNAPPLLWSLGTILAFILLNIEIADFFGAEKYLRFEFSGNFARDMTYSIAWAAFALILLVIGIRKKLPPARYASLALLVATLVKLFFHDLRRLDQGYRVGAFIGVAIILIFASWAYQKFLGSNLNAGANSNSEEAS